VQGVRSDANENIEDAGATGGRRVSYDHRVEVRSCRERAALLREQAASVRAEAEARARALEREADRQDQLGSHVHRLCTAGSNTRCCAT